MHIDPFRSSFPFFPPYHSCFCLPRPCPTHLFTYSSLLTYLLTSRYPLPKSHYGHSSPLYIYTKYSSYIRALLPYLVKNRLSVTPNCIISHRPLVGFPLCMVYLLALVISVSSTGNCSYSCVFPFACQSVSSLVVACALVSLCSRRSLNSLTL